MKTANCWSNNKLSPSLAPETIKKKLSYTTLPVYFDDVTSDKFLSKITAGYDDGEVYETREVSNIQCIQCIPFSKSKTYLIQLEF